MPASQNSKHSPAAAKRKAASTSVSTPPLKKKNAATKRPANDDDFIMTLDSDDDVEDLDATNAEADDADAAASESESEPEQTAQAPADEKLTKNQRKRKEKAHLAGKEKIVESVAARSKSNGAVNGKQGMALDKDFEFDIFGDGSGADYAGAESSGWDMSVTGTRMHKKLNVDDIIEKRRKDLPALPLPADDDDEQESEDSAADDSEDDLDDDIRFAEYEDSDDDEDRFGGGDANIAGDDEDDQDAAEVDSQEDPLSSDASDASDDDDEAQDTQIAEQDQDSDSSQDDSDSETEQEKAKKAAFFAEEPSSASSSAKSKSTATETSFSTFALSRPVLRALSSLSFHKPTPIQSRTIPLALAAKDIVAGAVTGSGKTAAFMIPTIERLTWRAKSSNIHEAKTRVLILAPTRELAIQCYSVGKSIAKFTDIRFCLCVGGLSVKSQEAELKLRPEVVIATPGRLIDHVRNSASFTLDDIEILVMDEADRMLEDGFADELNEIVKSCPKGARQTMLFSATMTDDVEQLVRLSLKRPVRLFVDPKRSTAKKLIQEFVRVRGTGSGGVAGADGLAGVEDLPTTPAATGRSEDAQRPALLLSLCTRTFTTQTIVFVRSKKLAHQLKIVFGLLGLSAGELHGDLSQEQRIDALTAFRDGKTDFLLATDLASRGLDIKGVSTVINYDMPGSFESYLHRVGRTARAGRNGRSVTLVGEADRRMLKLAIKQSTSEQVKHRIIPAPVVAQMLETLETLKPEVDTVLREEKEEKALRIAEMELKKGENMASHADEIFSRPKRTWFQSKADKETAEAMSRAKYEATQKGKEGRDKYAGLSRKKRRSKMMREEIERERKEASASGGAKTAQGGSMDAGIRAAKKASRPTKLGVAPVKVVNKGKAKGSKGKSAGSKPGGGGKVRSSFSRDFGDKKRR